MLIISKQKLKEKLWFICIFFLCMSFPVQVLLFSKLPALIPYFIIFIICLLSFKEILKVKINFKINNYQKLFIFIYLFLFILHTIWQLASDCISAEQAISSIVIFVFPIIFYLYFAKFASKNEIQAVLWAIAIMGIINGIYFMYDEYFMMLKGEVNFYSYKAYYYMIKQAGAEVGNRARITPYYRSSGLLEKHSVSSAWIAIGCFAALSLIPKKNFKKRIFVLLLYSFFILLSLNFTSIASFCIVIILNEIEILSIFRGVIKTKSLYIISISISIFISILFCAVFVLFSNYIDNNNYYYQYIDYNDNYYYYQYKDNDDYQYGDNNSYNYHYYYYNYYQYKDNDDYQYSDDNNKFYRYISKLLNFQFDLVRGNSVYSDGNSYWGQLVNGFKNYFFSFNNYPIRFVFGDGFSPFCGVWIKGGDFGILDTLYRFGILFSLVIFISFIKIIYSSIKIYKNKKIYNVYFFIACLFIYVIFMEIHYSVWSVKSILPIIFIGLACYPKNR